MPRLHEIPKTDAHPGAQRIYKLLFGERDPVKEPGTATGTPGNWWTVFAGSPDVFDHCVSGFALYRDPKRKGKPNLAIARKCLRHRHFFDSVTGGRPRAFTRRSSRYLNCPSKLPVHIRLNKPANGEGISVSQFGTGAALGGDRGQR